MATGHKQYRRAKRLVQRWDHFQLGWTEVDKRTPVKQGQGFCVIAKTLFTWSANPLEIMSVGGLLMHALIVVLESHLQIPLPRMHAWMSVKIASWCFQDPSGTLSPFGLPALACMQIRERLRPKAAPAGLAAAM